MAAVIPLVGQAINDADLRRRIDSALGVVQRALDAQSNVLEGARLLVNVAIGTGDTRIYHGLGRSPVSWLVARPSGNAVVWEQTTSPAPGEYLLLRASAAVTCDLVVW